ncbi:MAG: hypothetical protein IKY94_04780, partial [Lachnospiraceae bacterium]|nr:hypothetical protein [Lachnospiraceae bacterium]
AYFENVEKRVAETNGIHKKYDTQRYTKKAQMSQLIATWREELKNDSEILQDKTLAKLLKDMEIYAALDVTATHSTTIGNVESARRELNEVEKSVKEESKQLTNLAKNVQKYIEELETKSEQHQGIEEETLIARRQVMAQNIQLLIEEQINGYLPEISEDACHIRAKDKNIATMGGESFSDYRNMPLFPHDPSPSDIKQGYIGDCYMVSVLANIAKTNPDKIKEAIRDNGDGTVTVRLFQRTVSKYEDYFAPDATPPTKMEPFYVTVDKTIPRVTSARNCLWAALIEKAVVASGLTVDKRYSGTYARPVPDNIEELYEKYKNMREDQRPSKVECPWLFDKDNNLVKWKADYAQIEGGHSEMFTESFLGEGYEAVRQETSPARTNAARDVVYDFIMMQVGKATDTSYEEKARKILESRGDASQRLRNAYSLLRGLKNHDVDWRYTPSFTAKGELERLDKISYDSDRSYQGFVESAVNPLASCLLEGSIRYPDGSFADEVTKAIEKDINAKIGNYNTKEQETLRALMEDFKQNQEHILSGISGRKYPISYEKKFEEIKNEIAAGHIVAASSPYSPEGDVDFKGGIFYSHAYNVIGTEEEEINGKNYKFVVMRNPHGSDKVPVYDYSSIPPKAMDGIEPNAQGVFKMELSHFISNMDSININGKEMSEEEKFVSDKLKLGYIQQNIMAKYDRVFTELDKNLQKAMKEDPENQQDIQEIRNRIQEKLLAKENMIISGNEYRPFKVLANDILKRNNNLKPATRRIIEAAAEFAEMRANKITDPMAEIRKDKTMNDLGESQRTDSFYDGSKLTEKIDEYAAKKYEMLKKKQNFEKQKNRRDEVKNKLLEGYTKEEINNLISDYEAEERKILEYSKIWNTCIDAKNQAQNRIKSLNKDISEYRRKINSFLEENEKKDKAVEKLKECLKTFEEKQKRASDPVQDTEKKKEDSQDELKQKEVELVDAKKLFNNLVNAMAKTPEEKEYIQLRLDGIENPNAWIDYDRMDELEMSIPAKALEGWKKRLQRVEDKQKAYFEKKAELEGEALDDEFDDFEDKDNQTAMIKEAFDFKPGEFNPLSNVPVKEYVKEAKEYISKVENERFKRKKDLENLKKAYNDAVKDRDNVDVKLKQIESKEKETMNSKEKLQKAHEAKEKDYKLLKETRDSYNAAYKDAFEKTERLEALDVKEEIKKITGEFLDKQNLNASNHTNSPEFSRMIQALTILKNWPNIDFVCKDMPTDKRPTSLEGALNHLKKQAEDYKTAKNKQIHIFKTAIYKTRMSMADSIIDFAKTTKKDLAMDNKAERAELNSYFENKGQANGELKADKQKDVGAKETKQINAPEVEDELGEF